MAHSSLEGPVAFNSIPPENMATKLPVRVKNKRKGKMKMKISFS
jgi:hypothetical protein